MPWSPIGTGLERKSIPAEAALDDFDTFLLRLAAGSSLPPVPDGLDDEWILLEGDLSSAAGAFGTGDYARHPWGSAAEAISKTGCTLLRKQGKFPPGDRETVHLQAGQMPWLPGQGNLRVKALHSFEGHNTALVHWPAGERFVLHQHWGGEEIYVLSGTFEDEHGRYPKGTWIQSPHLSRHHPFVQEETVILVKTGHLPQGQP